MLTSRHLSNMAKARLEEAEMLFSAGKFDTSYYLCGYAVELCLKARMVETLKWAGFPDAPRDIDVDVKTWKTHNLKHLSHLTGYLDRISSDPVLLAAWSVVTQWEPDKCRYRTVGSATQLEAADMIASIKVVMREFSI